MASQAFVDFLKSVDLPRVRDEPFIQKALAAFAHNEVGFSRHSYVSVHLPLRLQVTDKLDLVGADIGFFKEGSSSPCECLCSALKLLTFGRFLRLSTGQILLLPCHHYGKCRYSRGRRRCVRRSHAAATQRW